MGLPKLNWIFDFFKKKEEKNQIIIEYDKLTGNFTVEAKISDLSVESAEVLAILVFSDQVGALTPYFYESLTAWAGHDIKKLEFNGVFAEFVTSLIEEGGEEVNPPAVRASHVFNVGE